MRAVTFGANERYGYRSQGWRSGVRQVHRREAEGAAVAEADGNVKAITSAGSFCWRVAEGAEMMRAMPAFALTIFTGAFLLFQVQPLIGKYILPWFGGGPGVWTTCMLFFQALLLGGYAYAHLLSRLKPRTQALVHLVLLVAALALLPITPSSTWKPHGGENPVLRILALLTVTLGLPYFVLSSTGPLMQQWFSRANPGRSPYRLYALSNVGSLLALVTYPFLVESYLTRLVLLCYVPATHPMDCRICSENRELHRIPRVTDIQVHWRAQKRNRVILVVLPGPVR